MTSACLPWYDFPEYRAETDALWRDWRDRLRAHGIAKVPDRLRRDVDWRSLWTSPALLLSQACGYDAILAYRSRLRIVATPRYAAPGCSGHRYRSWIAVRDTVRADRILDLRGLRCAINSATSHSGMNALRALVAPFSRGSRFFSAVIRSGSHERSLDLLRAKRADVAAVDCVAYEMLRRRRPHALRNVRILTATDPYPAPPYVTSVSMSRYDVLRIRRAILESFLDPATKDIRQELMISGIEIVPLRAYQPMITLERRALRRGFVEFPHATGARSNPCTTSKKTR